MDDEFWVAEGWRTAIPEELCDDESGAPFERCRICELNLQEPPSPYMVEKVIRHNPVSGKQETLFGYAICLDCAEDMKSQISRESMQAIQEFLAERVNFQERLEMVFRQEQETVDKLLHECMLSSKTTTTSKEYQIAGLCEGGELIVGMWPYMIDSEVAGELTALLSDETIGNMDDFYGQHFGLPPEWADLFKEKPVFWI